MHKGDSYATADAGADRYERLRDRTSNSGNGCTALF